MSVPARLLFNLQSGSGTNGMSACAAPNGNTADDPDQNVLQIQRKGKKKYLHSAAPPSLYKHSKVKSTRGLLNDQPCVMKFSLQNPQVLKVSGRDKRPGRKSNLFHRVIIFHLLQLLPELGKKKGKLGLSPPNAAKALCPLAPLLCLAASQGRVLAQLQGWHPAHWFREEKAWKRHPSTNREKNAQGCDPKFWEKGWRAPLVIPLPQVMPVGTWARCLLWASGLAARYLLAMFWELALFYSLFQV